MAHYILADNQELTRFALECLIKQDERNTIGRISDKAGLVQELKEEDARCVVVLDYTLFDFADEAQLIVMSERFPATQWVLISDDLTVELMRRMIYASPRFSIVFKDCALSEVREALLAAADGKRFVAQKAMEQILAERQEETKTNVLTATEMEIVKAIAKGMTTKEIADERFSSVHTVTTHRKNIFRKLGVNTAHEAIRYAIRSGWVDPNEFYI